MMKPLVSILIPVYNREHLVGETIESALAQSYSNIEIIIVDNCSTDSTWNVLKIYAAKDNRIKLFQNSENVGPVLNWKRCIDEAKGEYAKILFSDDLIANDFIENSLSVFNDDTAFVLSEIEVFNSSTVMNNLTHYKKCNYTIKQYYEEILLYDIIGFPVSPGCALFRTEDIKKSLIVDIRNELNLEFKKFGAGNDLLLFLLVAKNYSFISIAPNTKALFRYHSTSFTIANDLSVYYNYSKYFFIKQHLPEMLPKFKTILWFRYITHKKLDKVLDLMKYNIDFLFLVKLISKKFLNKVFNFSSTRF